jgi:beta-galactosidase
MDYSEASQAKFRAWLKAKYGTIDELNSDWGNSFWSQMYQNFDQIRLPNAEGARRRRLNPQAVLDSQRWFADEAADYLRFQAGILRKYCGEPAVDHDQLHAPFPGSTPRARRRISRSSPGRITRRTAISTRARSASAWARAAAMSFYHDYTRSLNGFEGLMELQPGQVNWGEVNPQPYPGPCTSGSCARSPPARGSSAPTASGRSSPARRCTTTASWAPTA